MIVEFHGMKCRCSTYRTNGEDNTVKDKHHRKLVKYYESLAEDRYTYTGATDIVLTAVAKALALDTSALCDSKYIASDLL